MASGVEDDGPGGVEFVRGPDGRVTATDCRTGVASFGDTRAEALRMLADALESREAADGYLDEDVPESDAPWLSTRGVEEL